MRPVPEFLSDPFRTLGRCRCEVLMSDQIDYEALREALAARRARSGGTVRSAPRPLFAPVPQHGSPRLTPMSPAQPPLSGSVSGRIDYDELRRRLEERRASGSTSARVAAMSEAARRPIESGANVDSPFGSFGQSVAEESEGGGGLLGNLAAIKDVVASAPAGLVQLGAEAVDSTVGNIGAMVARRIPVGRRVW